MLTWLLKVLGRGWSERPSGSKELRLARVLFCIRGPPGEWMIVQKEGKGCRQGAMVPCRHYSVPPLLGVGFQNGP